MIGTCYPFELKNITSINEYLFIIKNCFRLIEKNGISRKSNGVVFFVRWEKTKDKWVIDFSNKTSRKPDGYCLNDLNNFPEDTIKFNLIKDTFRIINTLQFDNILNKYFLKTQLNKAIGFIYENNIMYVLGLYRYTISNYKLIYREIESKSINKELQSNSNINSLTLQIKINNYANEFNKFLSHLKGVTLEIENSDNVKISNYFNYKKNLRCKRLTYNKYNNLIKSSLMPCNKELFYYILYSITIEVTKYINQKTLYADKSIDLIINDKFNNKKIKLPFAFYKHTKTTDFTLLQPLLPRRY